MQRCSCTHFWLMRCRIIITIEIKCYITHLTNSKIRTIDIVLICLRFQLAITYNQFWTTPDLKKRHDIFILILLMLINSSPNFNRLNDLLITAYRRTLERLWISIKFDNTLRELNKRLKLKLCKGERCLGFFHNLAIT